jgi:hypothetical protein
MTTSRTASLVLATALAGATLLAPAGAHAAGSGWTTIGTVSGSRLQFCKESAGKDKPWKVKARIDATDGVRKTAAVVLVLKDKNDTGTPGAHVDLYGTPGEVSATKVVKLPRDGHSIVDGNIGDNHHGDGAFRTPGQLATC